VLAAHGVDYVKIIGSLPDGGHTSPSSLASGYNLSVFLPMSPNLANLVNRLANLTPYRRPR
jgi:hypothetical protein